MVAAARVCVNWEYGCVNVHWYRPSLLPDSLVVFPGLRGRFWACCSSHWLHRLVPNKAFSNCQTKNNVQLFIKLFNSWKLKNFIRCLFGDLHWFEHLMSNLSGQSTITVFLEIQSVITNFSEVTNYYQSDLLWLRGEKWMTIQHNVPHKKNILCQGNFHKSINTAL